MRHDGSPQPPASPPTAVGGPIAVLIAAHNEADRLPDTLAALARVFPGARVVVADDGSTDGTAEVAAANGAEVVRSERNIGKGGAATLGARRLLTVLEGEGALSRADAAGAAPTPGPAAGEGALSRADAAGAAPAPGAAGPAGRARAPIVLLCDGDLAASADALAQLVETVRAGDADLAVAAFARRVGGGFGLAVGFAHWAIKQLCGLETIAPISGQRALRADVLASAVPFAPRFGMEIGMTVDAVRAGYRVREVELPLTHRATGKTLRGFLHRGRQLADFVAVYLARR